MTCTTLDLDEVRARLDTVTASMRRLRTAFWLGDVVASITADDFADLSWATRLSHARALTSHVYAHVPRNPHRMTTTGRIRRSSILGDPVASDEVESCR
jgi:hypothetical protein